MKTGPTDRADGATPLREIRPFLVLCVAAVAGAGLLRVVRPEAFRPYFGPLDPALATGIVIAVGTAALVYLRSRRWFAVHEPDLTARGVLVGAALAGGFAVPVIGIDLLGGFPPGINVEAPASLVFYPVMALVAELVFHAVPLALLLLLAGPLLGRLGRPATRRWCMALAALIEPALQVAWAPADSPGWATTYVGLHVLAINVTALCLFERFDFLTALAFRTAYYLLWHIAWGSARLMILFGG